MKRNLLLPVLLLCLQTQAQEEKLRISLKNGNPVELDVYDFKDITFIEDTSPLDIEGEWFNEEIETSGTYETFDFREDGSLLYCPYFVNYHEGWEIAGIYSMEDYTLTMQLSSLGRLTQYITNHSSTSFTTYDSGISAVYYRIQKEYHMTTEDEPISIGNEGDVVTFVDNEFVGLEGNRIKPLREGTGYALVNDVNKNATVAYKINIAYQASPIIDWTCYFKKTRDEIIGEFGTPDTTQDNTAFYTSGYNSDISQLLFSFDKASEKVIQVSVVPSSSKAYDAYLSEISGKYIKNEEQSSATVQRFYDNHDASDSSVAITLYTAPTMLIIYTDLTN